MKTTLILWILGMTLSTVRAGTTFVSWEDLRSGDWFDLEYVIRYPSATGETSDDFWSYDQVCRMQMRARVNRKGDDEWRIAFYLKHIYFNRRATVDNPIVYQIKGKGVFQLYYDSYYCGDSLSQHQPFLYFDIHKKKEEAPDIRYTLPDSAFVFNFLYIPVGMATIPGYTETNGAEEINYKILTEQVLLPFFNRRLPERSDRRCRLLEASFPLAANTQVIYKPFRTLHPGEAVLSVGQKDYPLQKQADGSYRADIFLASPQKAYLAGQKALLLTPGDSLTAWENNNRSFILEGRGAANSLFMEGLNNQAPFFFLNYAAFFSRQTAEDVQAKIEKGKAIYQSLYDQYGGELSSYWKRSFLLSQDYWEMGVRMMAYWDYRRRYAADHLDPAAAKAYAISWNQPPYQSVTPFTDYLYQPENYEEFLGIFFQYKAQQLDMDNLTHRTYWGNDVNTYYLKRQIFFGYPRIYLLSRNLEDMMENQNVATLRREYDDFLSLCRNPEIARRIERLWSLYTRLEPGKNIRDVGLAITKLLPLKKKADGYIILSDSYLFGDPQDFKTNVLLERILKDLHVEDKTALCFFRPESRRHYLPDSLKHTKIYTFVPDSIINHDKELLNLSPWALIVMRNDGTILSREVEKTEYGISSLKGVLEAAQQEGEKEKTFSRSEVYTFLISFILFFILASVFVRIRMGRVKLSRLLAELQLKALRSQMNPHFIFNALGSIQSLILRGENETASSYLTDFSRLLRKVLASSDKKLIPLSDEIEMLRLYLKMEQLRTPFEFTISGEASVNADTEEIPGMLLQPIVENAVIHGIIPQGGGNIEVRFTKKDSVLYCEVTDDGAGPDTEREEDGDKQHFGVRATEERLALLNKEYHARIGIVLKNRMEEEGVKGCRVVVSIPV